MAGTRRRARPQPNRPERQRRRSSPNRRPHQAIKTRRRVSRPQPGRRHRLHRLAAHQLRHLTTYLQLRLPSAQRCMCSATIAGLQERIVLVQARILVLLARMAQCAMRVSRRRIAPI